MIEDDGATGHFSYDGVNRLLTAIDAFGNSRGFAYDQASNVIETVSIHLATDGATLTEVYTSQFEYDVLNRLTRTTDNLGNVNAVGYDSRNNATHTLDALLNTTRRVFDGASRLREQIVDLRDGIGDGQLNTLYAYDQNSRLTTITDDVGNATSYLYDALNRLKQTTYANTGTVAYSYDADDNLLTRTDQNGTVLTNSYDAINRLLQTAVTLPGGGAGTVTTENGTTQIVGTTLQTFEYDGANRVIRATDNNEPSTTADDAECVYAYDSLSRIRSEVQTFGAVPYTVAYDWVSDNRQAGVTYPGGTTLARAFDVLDRFVSMDWSSAPSHGGAADLTYTYTGPAHVLTRRVFDVVTRDVRDPTMSTRSGYDGLKRMTHLDYGPGTLTFGYDAVSNRKFEHDSQALGTSPRDLEIYAYDNAYRLTGYTAGLAAAPPVIPETTTPTGDTRLNAQVAMTPALTGTASTLTWVLNGVGSWSQFDDNGSVSTNSTGAINQYQTFGGHTLDHAPNGNTVVDVPATGSSDQRRYEYDAFNRMRAVYNATTSALAGRYAYDAAGRRVFREADVDGDGSLETVVRYVYDGGRVIEERDGATQALQLEFVYGLYIDEPIWFRDVAAAPTAPAC